MLQLTTYLELKIKKRVMTVKSMITFLEKLVGIKRLHDDLGVNTAKVRDTAAKHNLVLLVILVKNMLSINAAGIKVNAAGYNC
ncbi:hypothetical protein Tco_0120578 [Tanacetum coccineum]